MAIRVDLQGATELDSVPPSRAFERWVEAALQRETADLEQTIRVVDAAESESLNRQYRGKAAPTNVLAFVNDDALLDYDCLGDLVICAPVVAAEAEQQGKPVESHWAHMVVHGMLHLQGFEHDDDAQAARMEALEVKILDGLGYTNPYND